MLTYGLQCVYQNRKIKSALELKRYGRNTPLFYVLTSPHFVESIRLQELKLFSNMAVTEQ